MFCIGLSARILYKGFLIAIFDDNAIIYCKIRTYTLFAISRWVFVFASLDRYYSTNRSALKRQYFYLTSMAFKLIDSLIIGCLLPHIHIIISSEYLYKLDSYDALSLTCTANNKICDNLQIIILSK